MQPVVLRIRRKRSSSASSWVASEPPTVALWPSMYLVVESTLMSAPSWNTGCNTGVRKVLSTARRTPCRRATAAIAGMSHSLRVGFPGVSMKINFVRGLMACSTSSARDASTSVCSMPSPVSSCWHSRTGAAVDHFGDDHVVTGLKQRKEQCGDRGHAGGETHRGRCSFQRSQGAFQTVYGWVRCARIGKALVNSNRLLHEGCGLTDRLENGASGRIRSESAMYGYCRYVVIAV